VLSQSSQEDFWVNAFFQVFSWETRSAQSNPRLLLVFPSQLHTEEPPCTATPPQNWAPRCGFFVLSKND